MWLVGFLILLALPMARGTKRFSTAPPSTEMVFTKRRSTSDAPFCSAFATAELSSLEISLAEGWGENRNILRASCIFLPLIISTTKRVFRGERRAKDNFALASIHGSLEFTSSSACFFCRLRDHRTFWWEQIHPAYAQPYFPLQKPE